MFILRGIYFKTTAFFDFFLWRFSGLCSKFYNFSSEVGSGWNFGLWPAESEKLPDKIERYQRKQSSYRQKFKVTVTFVFSPRNIFLVSIRCEVSNRTVNVCPEMPFVRNSRKSTDQHFRQILTKIPKFDHLQFSDIRYFSLSGRSYDRTIFGWRVRVLWQLNFCSHWNLKIPWPNQAIIIEELENITLSTTFKLLRKFFYLLKIGVIFQTSQKSRAKKVFLMTHLSESSFATEGFF